LCSVTHIREAGLTLNRRKCEFAVAELDYFGHHVGLGRVTPRQQKVEALLKFPRPTNRKQLQSFLGLASQYHKYLPHFANLSANLSDMLRKGVRFVWTESAEQSFLDIKSRLASQPVLVPPDFNEPFIIAVDASDVGSTWSSKLQRNAIGADLLQVHDGLEQPVCFMSRKLNVH